MSSDLFSVEGKVVIVTGASRGIGRAIAEGFLRHGGCVVFVARSPDIAERVGELNGEQALGISCNIGDADSAQRICRGAVEKFGRIDTLVNNAGISNPTHDAYSDENWEQTFNINLKAAFRLSRAAGGLMTQYGGGSIINVASIGAILGFPDNPSYQASKAGLRQLTRAMARDWAQQNIRVNNLCPGYFLTDMTRKSYDDSILREQRSTRTMFGRWGACEELVGPCLFLASQASSYMTGTDLIVDGGWTAQGL